MPIEFNCPSCQSKIRTPDNSAGRSARCPKCSTVVTIPAASTLGLSPPAGFSAPPPNPLGAPTSNPLGGPPAGTIPNPFGEKTASPFGPQSVNPYATPSAAASQPFFQSMPPMGISREAVRGKVMGPAIGMIAGAVVTLLHIAFTIVIMAVNPALLMQPQGQNEAEMAGYWVGAIGAIVVGTLVYILQLAGGICLLRCRNQALAMTGAIAGLIPCNICCVIGFPFSIWGLVVLNRPDVKAAFRLP